MTDRYTVEEIKKYLDAYREDIDYNTISNLMNLAYAEGKKSGSSDLDNFINKLSRHKSYMELKKENIKLRERIQKLADFIESDKDI